MNIRKCSRCNERPAVIFITKQDGGKMIQEGYCFKCARELGLKPLDQILQNMGINEEEFDALTEEMDRAMPMMANDDADSSDEQGEEGKDGSILPGFDFRAVLPNHPEGEQQTRKNAKNDPKAKHRKCLNSFCIDLTARARDGKLDRVVGRATELERVVQILSRRQKNNPCLIGEPGVGKTAVAEALAQKIVAGEVPYKLKDKEIFLVDMTAIVAGTQFRGQFENRMKGLIDEVKENGNIILVIDEIHTIVGAGSAEGSMNAANILKPALSRGEVQVIGATTLTEYRKYIENDAALERRFQPVTIAEPSIADSIEILKGIRGYYERFHGIRIPDRVVRRMVTLSERYINDRFLPDKAIDLMDEACANVSMHSPVINELNALADEIKALEKQQSDIEAKENMANEDYAKLAELKTIRLQKDQRFDKLSAERDKLELTEEDLAKVIEVWTGIPASSIGEQDAERIGRLPETLKGHIIGQDEAIDKVVKAIRRSRAGISYKKKPVSFIFAGPTGVGKTQLVKDLAAYLFDTPDALIRLDMSEYMEKYAVSRILGSPPGYVGYDDAGQLTEKIRRRPYSVVLFDEIEKAHPDVLNVLLQVLDDGRITDSHGKEVNFENTVIVMTTNAGSGAVPTTGFTASGKDSDETRVRAALEAFLRPEFINRVDDIVVFNRLSEEQFVSICGIMLRELADVLSEKGIALTWDPAVEKHLASKGYSEKYGARNLRRLIQTDVEDPVAETLVGRYRENLTAVRLDVSDDTIVVNAM
ncbi:MAG: ATP-dependent Clp protease ATP-binding subunit [Clostridiales bacterium]|nr:ATP-dependent Clp protease ATP-binding subunit [Candidatus Coliplasma caballi]